jgi:hypothetical protein
MRELGLSEGMTTFQLRDIVKVRPTSCLRLTPWRLSPPASPARASMAAGRAQQAEPDRRAGGMRTQLSHVRAAVAAKGLFGNIADKRI